MWSGGSRAGPGAVRPLRVRDAAACGAEAARLHRRLRWLAITSQPPCGERAGRRPGECSVARACSCGWRCDGGSAAANRADREPVAGDSTVPAGTTAAPAASTVASPRTGRRENGCLGYRLPPPRQPGVVLVRRMAGGFADGRGCVRWRRGAGGRPLHYGHAVRVRAADDQARRAAGAPRVCLGQVAADSIATAASPVTLPQPLLPPPPSASPAKRWRH